MTHFKLCRFGVCDRAGYDQAWFDDPTEDIVCGMCLSVLREPMKSLHQDKCEHSFCRTCIVAWVAVWGAGSTCPVCAVPVSVGDMERDVEKEDDIMVCGITCLNGDCTWKGAFGDLTSHLDQHGPVLPTLLRQPSKKRRHQLVPNVCKEMYAQYARKHGVPKTATDITHPYKVPESTIRDWVKGLGNSGLPGHQRAPSSNVNMIVLGAEREIAIFKEITQRRSDLRFVTVESVQVMAMEDAPVGFRASRSWLDRFFRDYNLALKVPTFRKRTKAEGSGEGLRESITEHWNTVNGLRQHHGIELRNIINYDQLRLSYESHVKHVVDFVGSDRAEVHHEVRSC